MKKVGIFAGSFDPVHAGHIGFALKSLKACSLEKVYFLPEQKPRGKGKITKFNHRLKMLELAVENQPDLDVLTLPDKKFSVNKTMPRLSELFPGQTIVFLMGSDVVEHLPKWKHADSLVAHHSFVIGLRKPSNKAQIQKDIKVISKPHELIFVASPMPALASSSLRTNQNKKKMIPDVLAYAEANKLYS